MLAALIREQERGPQQVEELGAQEKCAERGLPGSGLGAEAGGEVADEHRELLPAGYFKPAFLSSYSIATKMNGVASGCPCDSHFTPLT